MRTRTPTSFSAEASACRASHVLPAAEAINGADWSKRYPLIAEAARKIDGNAIIDAEVVWLDSDGAANFDALHSRVNDQSAVALAFDLMSLDGEDFRACASGSDHYAVSLPTGHWTVSRLGKNSGTK